MNIASMLNTPSGPTAQERHRSGTSPAASSRCGFSAPSSSLPTPSPEYMPSTEEMDAKDSRVRKPWDGSGYSLPRVADSKASSMAPFSARSQSPEKPQPAPYYPTTPPTSKQHSRHVSMESSMVMSASSRGPSPFAHPHPTRRLHSTSEVHTDTIAGRIYSDAPKAQQPNPGFWSDHLAHRTPEASRHRISDSRSSLSSYCSSTFSGGHSRISSISTVTSSSMAAADMPMLTSKFEHMPQFAERRASSPRLPPLPQHGIVGIPQANPSDTFYEDRRVRRKRSRLSVDQGFHNSTLHKRTISAPNHPQVSGPGLVRASSFLPPITSERYEPVLPPPHPAMQHRRSTSSVRRPSPVGSEVGRRTSLAMDGGRPSTIDTSYPSTGMRGQGLAMSAPAGGSQDRLVNMCHRFGLTVDDPLRGGDICMQVENCNTGSVPRKVISHIFGRNKVCTRRIPERTWVCMCRKHYQRIRYRKGPEFSMTQIDLVYEQIARMIFWSQGLESNGGRNAEGIYIRSWTFSIRKRELRRLVEMNGQDPLPRWIIQSLGEGKTNNDILDIVERLHQDIQAGILRDVPPVEFLPEVVDSFANGPSNSAGHVKVEAPDSDMRDVSHTGPVDHAANEEAPHYVKDSSPLEPVMEEERLESMTPSEGTSSPIPSVISEASQTHEPGAKRTQSVERGSFFIGRKNDETANGRQNSMPQF